MTDISNMTDEQLNEALAIEVMGWTEKERYYQSDGTTYKFYVYGDNKTCVKENWNPTHDLNQAFEVLDKWHSFSTCNISHAIYRNGEKYLVTLDCLPFQSVAQVKHKSLARAICEAVLTVVRKDVFGEVRNDQ